VLSIAGILQVLHKTDVEEKFGKGDCCRKAQNHPEDCISEGRKLCFRARNSAPGPEISPQGRNFRPWTKFLGARNSIISGPSKFG
jgi:hypothetical protein